MNNEIEKRVSTAYLAANRAIENLQEEMRICESEPEMDMTLSAYVQLIKKLEVAKLTLLIKQTQITKANDIKNGTNSFIRFSIG